MSGSPRHIKIYTDGASRGNPGPGAWAFIFVEEDDVVHSGSDSLKLATNNFAEYEAIIQALKTANKNGYDEVDIYSDSELVVKQITGKYMVKKSQLAGQLKEIKRLLDHFSKVSFYFARRNSPYIQQAHRLCSEKLENTIKLGSLSSHIDSLDDRLKKYLDVLQTKEKLGRLILCMDIDFFSETIKTTARLVSHLAIPPSGITLKVEEEELICNPASSPGWSQEVRYRDGRIFDPKSLDWSCDYTWEDQTCEWTILFLGSYVRYFVKGQQFGLPGWVEPDRRLPKGTQYPLVIVDSRSPQPLLLSQLGTAMSQKEIIGLPPSWSLYIEK